MTTAYVGLGLSIAGALIFAAALIVGLVAEQWRDAFLLLLISYPVGTWGDRMVDKAHRDARAQRHLGGAA